jgi:hypothetical protein
VLIAEQLKIAKGGGRSRTRPGNVKPEIPFHSCCGCSLRFVGSGLIFHNRFPGAPFRQSICSTIIVLNRLWKDRNTNNSNWRVEVTKSLARMQPPPWISALTHLSALDPLETKLLKVRLTPQVKYLYSGQFSGIRQATIATLGFTAVPSGSTTTKYIS